MTRLVFLCSGGGGNLKFIHRCVERGLLGPAVMAGVAADRPCGALDYARAAGIPAAEVRYRRRDNAALLAALEAWSPSVIVTNIHQILDPALVARYRGRLINLHYSLLPAFKGLIGAEPVRRALVMGCRYVGTTVHHVDEEVDAGAIIDQSVVAVTTADLDVMMDAVFRSGCLTLLNALRGQSHEEPLAPAAFDEAFWSSLK